MLISDNTRLNSFHRLLNLLYRFKVSGVTNFGFPNDYAYVVRHRP
jgi:hypothetical protein